MNKTDTAGAVALSVIIPAYNIEKYLPKTLESLARQGDGGLEVIVVDDGSTDKTAEVARRAAQTWGAGRLKLFVQRNGGVSAARNEGLRQASGRYVLFLDGDDLLREGSLAAFGETAVSGCDICYWPFDLIGEGGETLRPYREREQSYMEGSGPDILRKMLVDKSIRMWTGCVAYRREFLLSAGLLYTPGCVAGEDLEFIAKALSRAGSVRFARGARAFYLQRVNSAINSYNIRKFDAVAALERLGAFLDGQGFSDMKEHILGCERPDYYIGTYNYNVRMLVAGRGLSPSAAVERVAEDLKKSYPDLERAPAVRGHRLLRGRRAIVKSMLFGLSPVLYYHLSVLPEKSGLKKPAGAQMERES